MAREQGRRGGKRCARYDGVETRPANPQTFSARLHAANGEEGRLYGRVQCHDHVDIIQGVHTSNERARVPGSGFVEFSSTVIDTPRARRHRVACAPHCGIMFFNDYASSS